jgi:hypothetical protein
MSLSKNTRTRILSSLADQVAGNELLGAVGVYGGFSLNSDASIKVVSGDISVLPDSGGAPGTYRVFMPGINSQIVSIDWFDVTGFTPRTPTGAETCQPRVCGYNFDPSLNQWYITVQIAKLSDNSVDATPPANFVVGVRVAVTLLPTANSF